MQGVKMTATRESYGNTLVELGKEDNRIVVLDADLAGNCSRTCHSRYDTFYQQFCYVCSRKGI